MPRLVAHEIGTVRLWIGLEPDRIGHRFTAVTGVAGHAGLCHVGLPVCVDVLGHLDHATRHHLGVLGVFRKINGVVTVSTAFRRCHPRSHGDHQARELTHAQIAQQLHVFINLGSLRTGWITCRQCKRWCVLFCIFFNGARAINLHHTCTAKAALYRFLHGFFTGR